MILRSMGDNAFMRLFVGFALAGAVAVMAAGPPVAEISNGKISATVYLPHPVNGFYKGTRFDWPGVVRSLEANGHSYYGPWFTKQRDRSRLHLRRRRHRGRTVQFHDGSGR